MRTFTTHSEEDTAGVARSLAAGLSPGSVVLVEGPLGAGKTAFVRGLVAGLGGDPGDVSSPTFTLVQRYAGRVPVNHVDLYRLGPHEVPDLGLEDLIDDGVLAVEWPDRWTEVPRQFVAVRIDPLGETGRTIRIQFSE
jgi:tRNA threonylcarbamoyladenosine biosynthesis protein TsaE